LVSKDFFAIFGEYMRFWYCFFYLLVALGNIVAVNIYLAVARGQWSLAKIWSGTVTFPTVVICMFFVSNYSVVQEATLPLLPLQTGLVISAVVMGISIFLLFSPEAVRNLFRKGRR